MSTIKEFLDLNRWGDKEQIKRRVITIHLLASLVIFLIAFFTGLYATNSFLVAFLVGVSAALTVFLIGITNLPIILLVVKKGWSKTILMVVSILMVIVGLLVLLWRYTRF